MVKTRAYKLEGRLAINIPSTELPEPEYVEVEETVTTPGYPAETKTTVPLIVIPHANRRTAVLLTYSPNIGERRFLEYIGLDPSQPVYIRKPQSDEWIRAHKYHWGSPTQSYGRVWYPWRLASGLRVTEREPREFFIRGTTPPTIIKRSRVEKRRNVRIRHLETITSAVEYATDRYRWFIPLETRNGLYPLEIFHEYPVEATCHLASDNIIDIDVGIPPELQHLIKQAIKENNIGFREMAVINVAKVIDDYPFLAEARATYISEYPKKNHETLLPNSTMQYGTLKEILDNTVKNMYNWHVILKNVHLGVYHGGLEQITPDEGYIGMGLPPVEGIRLRYADKYIRITNKKKDYYYSNDRIERDLVESPKLWMDKHGFLWLSEIYGRRLW